MWQYNLDAATTYKICWIPNPSYYTYDVQNMLDPKTILLYLWHTKYVWSQNHLIIPFTYQVCGIPKPSHYTYEVQNMWDPKTISLYLWGTKYVGSQTHLIILMTHKICWIPNPFYYTYDVQNMLDPITISLFIWHTKICGIPNRSSKFLIMVWEESRSIGDTTEALRKARVDKNTKRQFLLLLALIRLLVPISPFLEIRNYIGRM